MFSWVLAIVLLVTCVYFYKKHKRCDKYLPGPRGLPLVGNLFQMNKYQHISCGLWAKKFGPLYKIKLANTELVIISDYNLLKEMFSKSVFSGKLDFQLFDVNLDGKSHGIANTEGPHWEELRHFTLRQLRDFGFGKQSFEESIMVEVNELIEGLLPMEGKPVKNVKEKLFIAVVNSVWFIVAGYRLKQDSPKLTEETEELLTMLGEILASGGLLMFAPWIAKWFPAVSGYAKMKKLLAKFGLKHKKIINEHQETYSESFQRDFTDAYIKEIGTDKYPNSAFYKELGVKNLASILSDLYMAGTDTTASTLSWMMLYLTKISGVQKKFQAELESVTGNTRPCCLADRSKMPYTEAFIAESMRYSSILAFGTQHKVINTTEFKGYTLKKGTILIPNLFYIHHDPANWDDPENFRLERFLSTDGKSFKKHEALVPFSVGRRQCLGESLARDSLFLFITNIIQRFSVQFDYNGPDNKFESEVAFTLTPKPFHLIFKDRQC